MPLPLQDRRSAGGLEDGGRSPGGDAENFTSGNARLSMSYALQIGPRLAV